MPRSVFVLGFLFGFLGGLILLDNPRKPGATPKIIHPRSKVHDHSAKVYKLWAAGKGAHSIPVDLDQYLYGSIKVNRKRVVLESEWLKEIVHITCVMFVERVGNVKALTKTWLKHCNAISLFHAKKPHDLRPKKFTEDMGVVTVESANSWHFLCSVILSVWNKSESNLQWILFVSDDMFAVPENLRKMVAHLDWNQPFYFGHTLSLWGQAYNLASAGYVLSKGSVELLANNFTSSDSCKHSGQYWKKEDFFLGKNLEKLSVFPNDARDTVGRGRFHGYNLNQLLFKNNLPAVAAYWKNSLYPTTQGVDCCSEETVALQGIDVDRFFFYYYLVYHLHIFTHGNNGNKPAPTPFPPDQIWQQFMLQEGFSDVYNVSSEQYFAAWKSWRRRNT